MNGDLSIREEARGAGRPAKVDRQEMVGTWAAIKRWTKTVDHEDRKARIKEECLSRVVVLGERHLRLIVQEYIEHYHGERNHQGLDNRLVERAPAPVSPGAEVHRRERIGGLLNSYHRAAA